MKIKIKESDILIETAKAKFIKINDERGFWIPASLVKYNNVYIPEGFKVITKAIVIDDRFCSMGYDAKINILDIDDKELTEDLVSEKVA